MELLTEEIERIGHEPLPDWTVRERYDAGACWWTAEDWPTGLDQAHAEESAQIQSWRPIFECVALRRLSDRASTIEQTFRQLEARWRNETAAYSLTQQKIAHIAYLQIIGLAQDALPYIFAQLQQHRRYWFVALEAITRENPVEHGSSFEQAVNAWLEWGAARGYLTHVAVAD